MSCMYGVHTYVPVSIEDASLEITEYIIFSSARAVLPACLFLKL